jgi:hypothetical protein
MNVNATIVHHGFVLPKNKSVWKKHEQGRDGTDYACTAFSGTACTGAVVVPFFNPFSGFVAFSLAMMLLPLSGLFGLHASIMGCMFIMYTATTS